VRPPEELIATVLAPRTGQPGSLEVERLVNELLAAGQWVAIRRHRIPTEKQYPVLDATIRDWMWQVRTGPRPRTADGTWAYAQALAKVLQSMVHAMAKCQDPPS
jgi:hypothetical protein